jgi:hypothetical protein
MKLLCQLLELLKEFSPQLQLKEWGADIKKSQLLLLFYDGLENMKVQMNTSSLSFKSINRVVLPVANTRFMHWLMEWIIFSFVNFVLGNLIGFQKLMFKV